MVLPLKRSSIADWFGRVQARVESESLDLRG
jgi:hypothetical protein